MQRYESSLQMESIDLLQVLLTLDVNVKWIQERALENAKVESDIEYWKMAE